MSKFLGVWDHCPQNNQFSSVAWVACHADGDVMCNLCGTGWMNHHNRRNHFNGRRHAKNMDTLRNHHDTFRNCHGTAEHLRTCDTYELQISKFPSIKWRESLRAMLHKVVMKRETLHTLKTSITRYENKEALTLVDLWCLKCKACSGPEFYSMNEIREYIVLDANFEATAFLRLKWIICGSQFITSLVKAFLLAE